MRNLVEYKVNLETGDRVSKFVPFLKTFLSEYSKETLFSCGGHSKVNIVTHIKTGKKFLCKTVKTDVFNDNEFKVPNAIDSEHILKIIEVYEKYEKSKCYTHLIMEYRENSMDLFDYITRNCVNSEVKLREIMKEVVKCIKVLHDHSVCHGDLKFENFVVIEEFPLKLMVIDFGFAFYVEPDEMKSFYGGTIPYVAPEIFEGRKASLSSDIWSMGMMAYYVTTLKRKVSIDNDFEKDYRYYRFSDEFTEFMRFCLQKDPRRRKTIYEIDRESKYLNSESDKLYTMLKLKSVKRKADFLKIKENVDSDEI